MISSVDMGGAVDTMLLSGGYLFVAVTNQQAESVIRIWNIVSGQNHNLSGHQVSDFLVSKCQAWLGHADY